MINIWGDFISWMLWIQELLTQMYMNMGIRTQFKNGFIGGDSWVLVRNPEKAKQKHFDLKFFKTTELFLDDAFMTLLGIVCRRDFSSYYSLQLANAIYLCLYVKHVLASWYLPTMFILYLWSYNFLVWCLSTPRV